MKLEGLAVRKVKFEGLAVCNVKLEDPIRSDAVHDYSWGYSFWCDPDPHSTGDPMRRSFALREAQPWIPFTSWLFPEKFGAAGKPAPGARFPPRRRVAMTG
jgi:hypothetical protein